MIFGPVQNKTRPVNFARAGRVLYLVVFVLVKKGIRIRTWSSLCEEPNCVALRQQVPWGKRPCQGAGRKCGVSYTRCSIIQASAQRPRCVRVLGSKSKK